MIALVGGQDSTEAEPQEDEAVVLAEALVALRRAVACQSLSRYARAALDCGVDVLERYAPAKAPLRGVPASSAGEEVRTQGR